MASCSAALVAASARPGECRRSQNWIGPERCSLAEARYVPPPPDEANAAMGDLEER